MIGVKTRVALILGAAIAIAAAVAFVRHRPKPPPQATQAAGAITQAPSPMAASPPAPADCLLPGPPPVPPDGATATAGDMRLGREVMQHFVNELEAYQACRNAQIDHAGKTVSDQQKDTWIQQGNNAVDEAHALADAYSAQLKVFKARPGSPP